jgi:hypothetical protein
MSREGSHRARLGRPSMHSLAALALALVVCGCGRVPLDPGTRVPARHRTSSVCTPVDLSAPRPNDCRSSERPPPIPGACSSDADCKAGVHGRCVQPHIGTCGCVYDACGSDADCPAGKACACNSAQFGNACVPASCHIDADCGLAGFCGPVVFACADEINEYRCYTAAEQCLADSDCPAGEPCLAFSGEPWMCQPPRICN